MKQAFRFTLFAVSLSVLTMAPLAAATEAAPAASFPTSVTQDILDAKTKEVESAAGLTDEAKSKLIELYRRASSNLQAASADSTRAAAFEEATRTAPAQTELIRKEIETAKRTEPLASVAVTLDSPREQIEQQLKKEQAELAAADARRADLERRVADDQARPMVISQRLTEAKQKQQETAAALQAPPEADAGPAMNEARRWVQETRYLALGAEIKMLEQELLSQPMRVDLLQAEQDKAAGEIERIGLRVEKLSDLVNRKREVEAEQAKVAAEEAKRETEGMDPLLVRLAERNAELTEALQAMATRLNTLDEEQAQAEALAQRIEADFKDTQATLETGGETEGLGPLLLKHRESLPDSKVVARRAQKRAQQIAEVGGQRLLHREEARRMADLEQTVTELEAQLTAEKTPLLHAKLRELVAQRQTLLQKALEAEEFYLRQLREVDAADRKLIDAVRAYDELLDEYLWWLRVAEPTRVQDLGKLPGEVKRLFSPTTWTVLGNALFDQVARSWFFWFALLAAAGLLWKRRALLNAIEETSGPLGKPSTDRVSYTLRALVLTLITAAPVSLVLAVIGWQLSVSPQGTDLSHALGVSLLRTALLLYVLRALRMICMPLGLAATHFRWPAPSAKLLGAELGWLTWVLVPTVLVGRFALALNPVESGGVITRLGFLIFQAALALFLYRVFHPTRGVLAPWLRRRERGVLVGVYPVCFWVVVLLPLWLVVEGFAGYIHNATAVSNIFIYTLFLILGLVLLHALARRSLLVTRRRLLLEAAVERRKAALAAKQAGESGGGGESTGELEIEEPQVDVGELSDESQQLVTIAVVFAGLVGLYLIWSPLLPALRIFDDVNLWYQTVTVDGEAKRLPITLADIGLAVIYAIGAAVLVKRLPALLEIILLRRSGMSEADRYTVTKLTTYATVAIGTLLVLNTIGAQWSQLQWLVAALGVGIGFGLQEIVANFISGLIILFERPVRVGDVVTVGNTSGVVTKIRIRATTIRDWDRKEFLVPNKDLITGQVLNWSLSDELTRIVIVVGVAYGTDVDKALALMREAAEEHEHVLKEPAPLLSFDGFGDNALNLTLRAYVSAIDHRIRTTTDLHSAINRKFEQAGIVIAFPQRDVHFDMREPLRVNIENAGQHKSSSK